MPATFGPYEILERLGEGGMGEVWSAKKRGGLERVVCIKRMKLDQRAHPDAAARFLREARLLGRLRHANVAQIFDAGEIDGEYFIEMELLQGKDLRSVMKAQLESGPPPPGLAITVATHVGRALDHAHHLVGADGKPTPIIHRDVTASNVMLGFDGAVKLVDFGLAKAPTLGDPRVTSTGVFVGTMGYIAPEVQRREPATAKSDQFALGVVFYEALTGRRLLDPSVARERPPSQCNVAIPAAIDAVCLRALADDPMKRFSSCISFVEAIDAAAPRLALDARGIASLLKARFSDTKAPASPVAPPFNTTAKTPIHLADTLHDLPAAPPPARRKPAPSRMSPVLWLSIIGAVGLLGAAIVWRLREPPAIATPASIPVAAPADPPTVIAAPIPAAAESLAPPPREDPLVPKDDFVVPFDGPKRKKQKYKSKKARDSADDMALTMPKF